MLPGLSEPERQRYHRHLSLPEVGDQGQRRLKAARVLVVGAGGLGSPLAMYLAAAGVGHLGIVDFDVVDVSNLQRQILHGTKDVGRAKVDSARDHLRDLNPCISVETYAARFSVANARTLVVGYDLVVDGTDNFASRYLINDACVLLGRPNVHGSIYRFEGQVSVFAAKGGPCYRCLYPEPPPPGVVPSCAEAGVLGVLPGIIGAIQAAESIKLLLGIGSPLVGRLLAFDALAMRFRELTLHRDSGCPICGDVPTITDLVESVGACPASTSVPLDGEVDAATLQGWLATGRDLQLIDVREPFEFQAGALPGAILIPLGEIHERGTEIDPRRETVVYCRVGVRSAHAIARLREDGHTGRLLNLQGGIMAYRRVAEVLLK